MVYFPSFQLDSLYQPIIFPWFPIQWWVKLCSPAIFWRPRAPRPPRAPGIQGPSRSGGGPLRRHELLRLWAVCPPEKLPQLDAALSEAVRKRGGLKQHQEIWGHFLGGKTREKVGLRWFEQKTWRLELEIGGIYSRDLSKPWWRVAYMVKLLSYKYGVCKIGHENWQTWWTQETLCMGFTIFFGLKTMSNKGDHMRPWVGPLDESSRYGISNVEPWRCPGPCFKCRGHEANSVCCWSAVWQPS